MDKDLMKVKMMDMVKVNDMLKLIDMLKNKVRDTVRDTRERERVYSSSKIGGCNTII